MALFEDDANASNCFALADFIDAAVSVCKGIRLNTDQELDIVLYKRIVRLVTLTGTHVARISQLNSDLVTTLITLGIVLDSNLVLNQSQSHLLP